MKFFQILPNESRLHRKIEHVINNVISKYMDFVWVLIEALIMNDAAHGALVFA